MATGQGQSGGVFALPDQDHGYETWASMSGVHPSNPLVGGRGATGGVDPDYHLRNVALGAPDVAGNAGAPMKAHYSEILNLKGNPVGWVLIAAIIYLGLAHISLHGRVGKTSAGFASG